MKSELLIPLVASIAVVCLVSCATTKEFVATGGSRADGMVALSYEYGLFEKPQEDQEQGITLATASCAGWGYTGANPFGETRQCEAFNGYRNCIRWMVTRRYQCIGAPSNSNVPVPAVASPSPPTKPETTPVGSGQLHQI